MKEAQNALGAQRFDEFHIRSDWGTGKGTDRNGPAVREGEVQVLMHKRRFSLRLQRKFILRDPSLPQCLFQKQTDAEGKRSSVLISKGKCFFFPFFVSQQGKTVPEVCRVFEGRDIRPVADRFHQRKLLAQLISEFCQMLASTSFLI